LQQTGQLGSGVRGWSRPAVIRGAAEDLDDWTSPRGRPFSPATRLEARTWSSRASAILPHSGRDCIRGCPSLAGRALAALQGIFEKAGVSSRGELVAKLFAAHHARSRLDRPERPDGAVV
jgi:hypothetical protein